MRRICALWTATLLVVGRGVATAQSGSGWKAPHANEFLTPWTSIKVGAAVLWEVAGYQQDSASRQQVAGIPASAPDPVDLRTSSLRQASSAASPPGTLFTTGSIRDSRFIINGVLKTKRRITWQSGLMYDGKKEKWFVRQTGFVVFVPEIYSNFWIGRTKEGPSLNRVMVGYDGWTVERFSFSDAAIPLLADGIRWQGYIPRAHFVWNLGYFMDALSKGQTFSYFRNQVAGRLGYVKMDSDTAGTLLHVALGFHFGNPTDGTLQLKSKPEANSAPNFVDTGKFPSTSAQLGGIEMYYRVGPVIAGSEYYLERATSPQTDNPVFHGGDASVTWTVTGEVRPYVAPGSYFRDVSPSRPVTHGGPGAWEAGLRLSNIDLDGGTLEGGKFWRFTPVVNWYLSDQIRLEFEYGYGQTDRLGHRGATHFYQSRIQLQL
jgi:phosphate-selective porin OprO/OprP